MAPRGKTPSLIGSGAGSSTIVTAAKMRTCKRCKNSISGGTKCLEVSVPGSLGHRTYCKDCYLLILAQSQTDLTALQVAVDAI
jgi:late competence protein required for DNA uptake (superfamily II DNA/RNA helicase)